MLERVVFADGSDLRPPRAVLHDRPVAAIRTLSNQLGCEFNDKGTVRTGKYETTHLPGLYVAGDASRAVQWVVVAAAEGAEAAFAINTDLTEGRPPLVELDRSFGAWACHSALRSVPFSRAKPHWTAGGPPNPEQT